MNGVHHNGKSHDCKKMYPEFMGSMANPFDLEVSANRLLNDKPHQGGSPLLKSRSDGSRTSPFGDPLEEKETVLEFKNGFPNRTSNGTPMKMLIAQEMSAEMDSRRDAPNLVAKLMGIDALPQQEPGSTIQRGHSRVHPRSNNLGIPMNYPEQQNGFFHYIDPNGFNDVYERQQPSQKSLHKERYEEIINDRKMDLVRQKFIEAKRLSMDEKLRQSKQFQDALDVLSSNKDLFLKCLQEPSSMFSQQHHYGPRSVPLPPETKRITVLRPSKVADSNDFAGARCRDEKQTKNSIFVRPNASEKTYPGSSPAAGLKYYGNPTQPTRIVVLRPSPGKLHNIQAAGSLQSEQPKILLNEEYFGEEADENRESREVAKAITQHMREKLGEHRRGETFISSVFSNGYVGDESSFNKSEIDCADGNPSDSEVMSPVSRHSWDYADRLGSPYSSSSFTRASCSTESSVCREAKKRLSERWSMMASNGSCQEQRYFRRSSSTLGDMLALFDTKNEASPREEGSYFEEPKNSDALLVGEQRREENVNYSPRNLIRSKSVPVSSTEFGTRLDVGISVLDKRKPESSKVDTKEKSAKSSFRWTSLLFSRNKKPGKNKSLVSETKDEIHSFPGEICSDKSESPSEKCLAHASPGTVEPNIIGKQSMISSETRSAVAEPMSSGYTGENHDQPSPNFVLDPPLEENEQSPKVLPHHVKRHDQHGIETPLNSIGSNLIDKSPPIGSIARTLSRDNACINTASLHTANKPFTAQKTDEEQECCFLVNTLLSASGLQGEVQPNSFLARWHSPESPLDPSLRDSYIDLYDKQALHEAKQRPKNSIQKLVFDCVNAVLIDISGYESDLRQRSIGPNNRISDAVWARMKVWFSSKDECVSGDCGADNSLVAERVVRKEVVGKGWNGNFRLELDHLRNEIGGTLLDELVQETVVELTGRI